MAQALTVTAVSSNTGIIPNPTVTYASPSATGSIRFTPVANAYGSVNVTVTVSDGAGGSTQRVFAVNVAAVNDAPVANFTANPTSGTAPPTGLVVSFTDTSTDIDNAITAWSWNLGDGTAPCTTQNTTHTYNQAGTFTVTLTVTDASGATNAKTGTVTVYAGISIGDLTGAISVRENVGNAVFTVSLNVPGANDVTVQYATANGTAKAAQDYTATSGTLTIAAGASSGTIAVPILNDTKVELTENFFVNLSSPSSNAIITGNQARCDIITDFIGRLRIDDVTVSENSGSGDLHGEA